MAQMDAIVTSLFFHHFDRCRAERGRTAAEAITAPGADAAPGPRSEAPA